MTSCSDQLQLDYTSALTGSLTGSSSPYRTGGTVSRLEGTGQANRDLRIARRDAHVASSTTRIAPGTGTDNTFSPFWLVTIEWANERCPTCEKSLGLGYQAAFDEEERACFCIRCAHKWLDR